MKQHKLVPTNYSNRLTAVCMFEMFTRRAICFSPAVLIRGFIHIWQLVTHRSYYKTQFSTLYVRIIEVRSEIGLKMWLIKLILLVICVRSGIAGRIRGNETNGNEYNKADLGKFIMTSGTIRKLKRRNAAFEK